MREMALHPPPADVLGGITDVPSVSMGEEMSKKVRKPYTITKSRESWTEQEHDKFLEALQLFDRDWKKIEAFVGSKTVIQIRSHAQKYFLKVQKNGTGEHVPPPRPKRKSAQPYPQKAAKTALVGQQVSNGVMPISQAEPACTGAIQPCAVLPVSAPTMPAWVHHMAPPQTVGYMMKGSLTAGFSSTGIVPAKDRIGCNKDSSLPNFDCQVVKISQGSGDTVLRAMPDFAEVYSFIGSVFDPSMDGHLKRMQEMAPIDRETVLLLMRNLSINLSSPDFEEHKLFLSVYDMDPEDTLAGVESDVNKQADFPAVASQRLASGDDPVVTGHEESRVSDVREMIGESEAREEKLTEPYGKGPVDIQQEGNACKGDKVQEASAVPRLLDSAQPSWSQHDLLRLQESAGFEECQAPEMVDNGEGEAEDVDMWWS